MSVDASVTLQTGLFEPKLECRLFCERTILNYFGYDVSSDDIIGLAGGPALYYFKSNLEKPFFTLYGKSIHALKNISHFLSGDHYREYNGTIEDLEFLTSERKVPVIVEVDFNKFYGFYPPYLQGIVRGNLSSLLDYGIMDSIPHQLLVLGVGSEEVYVADNMTSKVVPIARETFLEMWPVTYFEFGEEKKQYMEYLLLEKKESRPFPVQRHFHLKSILSKYLSEMQNERADESTAGVIRTKTVYGQKSIREFLTDLEKNSGLPDDNWNFSVKMIQDFDKYFSNGMYRASFAAFIEKTLLTFQQGGELLSDEDKKLYKKLIQSLKESAKAWQALIQALGKWDKKTRVSIDLAAEPVMQIENGIVETILELLLK